MSWQRHQVLTDTERAVAQTVQTFLNGRLESHESIAWALKLTPNHVAEQQAVLNLVDHPASGKLSGDWTTAWRLIEEMWDFQLERQIGSLSAIRIKQRVVQGDRTGTLIAAIVRAVAARFEISPRKTPPKKGKKPLTIHQILSVTFTSNEPLDPSTLGISSIKDVGFLTALAGALDVSVTENIERAGRLGWNKSSRWRLGGVRRVYYAETDDGENEPDRFGRGIAVSVKTLYAVVAQLSKLDSVAASRLVHRWSDSDHPLHKRLWAALARDPRLATPDEVATFLLNLDDEMFWYTNEYPEIAEMRAVRFGVLAQDVQSKIANRLKRLPPKRRWWREAGGERLDTARLYWAVRELRRIEAVGGKLPKLGKDWLTAHIDQFPDLAKSIAVDEGFLGGTQTRWRQANPDNKYDLFRGESRLSALEMGLKAKRVSWDDNPSERALDWIRAGDNARLLIDDFEASKNAGEFPQVWERFGWAHGQNSPNDANKKSIAEDPTQFRRVLALLKQLPRKTILEAIDGITNWMTTWQKQILKQKLGLLVWQKIWPIAVAATNASQAEEGTLDLNLVVSSSNEDREPMDLDTLNTPAGRMVGIFEEAWRATKKGGKPFAARTKPRVIRDIIIKEKGRAGLIVKHRLIELLPYFHNADSKWTQEHLLPHLLADTPEALALWRAVVRRPLHRKVIHLLKDAILKRALDKRLGRETRKALVFYIVVDCLHAMLRGQRSAIKPADIQQMLRSVEDEVRAHAAGTIARFVRENTKEFTQENLMTKSAAPFLKNVWPQELALVTPGTSAALVELPAYSGGAFVAAANAIERFLVPFDCWSLLDYGLFGEDGGGPRLAIVDSAEKGEALLRLLDLTVGSVDGAVVPYDLSQALAQITKVSPHAEATPSFRRLLAAARQ